MNKLLTAFWAFARSDSKLSRRQRRAQEVLEMVLPSRPQVRAHQKTAALHIQLAAETNWTGPSRWRGSLAALSASERKLASAPKGSR